MTAKKERRAMPELPAGSPELDRPDTRDVALDDDGGTLDGNLDYVPPSDIPKPLAHRELVYSGDSPREQLEYALDLYRRGRPYLRHCPTNLDLSTPRGRAMLANAAQPGDLELQPGKELRLCVRYWLVMPDRFLRREDGQVQEGMRTALITTEGGVYRTTSEWGPQRAAAMHDLFTPEEWRSGIPVIITARPSKSHPGGSWHDIRVDLDAYPEG